MSECDSETVADVQFIAGQLRRFAGFSRQDLTVYIGQHKETLRHSLYGTDTGPIFIGAEAYERFWKIADRELLQLEPHIRTDFYPDNVAAALRAAFVALVVEQGSEPDADLVRLLVSRAIMQARSGHAVIRHHVPCIITSDRFPEIFHVGPIEFRPSTVFLAHQADAFERYQRDNVSDGQSTRSDPLVLETLAAGAREFYARFPWVASVSVSSSNPKVSEQRATNAIDAALDVLRLFFPEPFASRLRRARSLAHVRKSAAITATEAGDIDIAMVYASDSAPAWLEGVLEHYGDHIRGAGEWLVAHVQHGTDTGLQRRYLDALHWYGQAIRDDTPAGRLVKLMAVLERLTIARVRPGGIRSVVVKRGALLAQGYNNYSLRDARKAVNESYEWRSRLVHGSDSPYDPRVREAAASATALIKWCVLEALAFFRHLHGRGLFGDEDLEEGYERWAAGLVAAVY
jgi:hypothetical protein